MLERLRRKPAPPTARSPASYQAVLDDDQEALAAQAGPLALVVPDAATRYFLVSPPADATHPADLQAAAAQRFEQLFGEPADAWSIEAAWDPRHPFFACAIRTELVGRLNAACARRGIAVASIVPRFVDAWNRHHDSLPTAYAWFAVQEGSMTTLAVWQDKRIVALRRTAGVMPLEPEADPARLAAQLQSEALVLDLPVPPALHGIPAAQEAMLRIALERTAP
jgi:hypothetical protein